MAKATSRIIVCKCPRCGLGLQIHVRGIPQTMTPREFLSQLETDDIDFIHRMHVEDDASMISMSRTRTKPITREVPIPRAKSPTKQPPTGRTTTRQRMRPITKP